MKSTKQAKSSYEIHYKTTVKESKTREYIFVVLDLDEKKQTNFKIVKLDQINYSIITETMFQIERRVFLPLGWDCEDLLLSYLSVAEILH